MTAPKPATRIINSGNGHSYVLDGEKVPGATTIIGDGVPKPWLGGYTARVVSEYVMDRLTTSGDHVLADELLDSLRKLNEESKYPKRLGDGFSRMGFAEVLKRVQYAERDAAGNKGTKVHDLAERLARGEEVEVPEALTGHVDSYLRFLEEWQMTNAMLERVVVNRRWRYMGKLDMIGDFPFTPVFDPSTRLWLIEQTPSRGLLDIKTSKSVYNETGLQLAAYRNGETMLTEDGTAEEPMPAVDWCGVVWVRADGYDVYPFTVDETVFRAFLYAKQMADFFADEGPAASLKGEALVAPALEVAS